MAQLRLEDIDWRNAVIRVRARKTGHGARLPLTSEVGEALADYLQHGRPEVDAREVFVLHWLRVGAPISTSIVGRAVQRAVDNAGIDAPARGGNLLRHSLATELLAGGASLPEIANVLGHSCLATTRIHAAVDIGRLRALPLHDFDQNRIWVAVVALAGELTAWMQMLVLHGHDARRWEPKRLRLRLFTIPATLAHTGRRVWLHLADKAPWANLAHLGITRLRELAVPG